MSFPGPDPRPSQEVTPEPAAMLRTRLLTELFSQLELRAIPYAVLRNYQGLPEKPGRDIDILTTDFRSFAAVMEICARKYDYLVRIFRRYSGMVKFHLLRSNPANLDVVEIDLAWSIRWKAIPLFMPDWQSRRRREKNLFYTLSPGLEAAISLTKNLIHWKAVESRYQPRLPGMALADREGFLAALTPTFGPSLALRLYELTVQANWGAIAALAPELRRLAVWRALRQHPGRQLTRWLEYFSGHLMRLLRPNGFFLVLVGPDGSGKSTISARLAHCLGPLFQGTKYYHSHFQILPRLGDLARLWRATPKAEDFSPRSHPALRPEDIRVGRLRSMIYLLYYTVDYLLGHLTLWRARGRGQLIIFDRYYYYYLIQPGLSLPQRPVKLAARLIPQPDTVIYLKNHPSVILSRKPELSREELERQEGVCTELITALPQGCVVETTGTPEETAAKAARIILDKILARERLQKINHGVSYN